MADHEWELSKENVAPLRKGRDVQVLNKALRTPKAQLEAQRVIREGQVRDAVTGRGPLSADPLEAWSRYIKWLVENYPSGCEALVRAIEEACRTYAKSDRYRDDIRFLRLWIRYIDLRDDKLDAFSYMNRRRIGESWSLFYEAWAITLELARRYDDAQKVYQTGRERNAKPVERLGLREEEYNNRMKARRRRDDKKREDAAKRRNAELRREEARKEQAGLRSGTSLANVVLSTSEAPVNASDSSSGHMVRPALGQITAFQAKSGRRPMTLEPRQRKFESTTPRTTEAQKSSETLKPQTFEVYSDPNIGSASDAIGTDHDPKRTETEHQFLSELAKRSELRKENEGLLPSKWAGQVLPQENALRRKMKKEAGASFDVYQDPIEVSSPSDPIILAAVNDVRESRSAKTTATNRALDGSDVSQGPPTAMTPKSWLRSAEGECASPTINTRLAMKEVDDVFNSSHSQSVDEGLSPIQVETASIRHTNGKAFHNRRPMNCDFDDSRDSDSFCEKPSSTRNMFQRNNTTANAAFPKIAGKVQSEPVAGGALGDSEDRLETLKSKSGSTDRQVSDEYDMTEFLASWCNGDSQFQLLEDPDPEVAPNEMFDINCRQGVVSFNADKFQGKGYNGQSYVVLADDLNNSFGLLDMSEDLDSDDDDFKVLAIKVSESSNAWEYYIYKTIHSRLATPSKSIPRAVSFCEGNPKSFLVLDSYSRCSLQAALEFYVGKKLPESLAMFFTIGILGAIEELHGIGVIHADVTLDNILFRYDLTEDISKSAYCSSGQSGWDNWGVLLVDFNHSVDARHPEVAGMDISMLSQHLTKRGNAFVDKAYRLPGAAEWAYNADCNAIKTCAAKMLGLSDSDVLGQLEGLQHIAAWKNFFLRMQEIDGCATACDTRDAMKSCLDEMGTVLEDDRLLSVSLMQLVNHIIDADNDDMTKGF